MDISLPDNWLDAASNLEVKNAVLAAALERDPFPLGVAELVDEFENLSVRQAVAAVRVLESHGLLRVAADDRFAITERGKQYLLARMAQAMMSARHGATNAVVELRRSLGVTHAEEVAMFAEQLRKGTEHGDPTLRQQRAKGRATRAERAGQTQHSRTLRERALSRLSWMALFGLLMWVYLEILLEAAR